MNKYWILAKTFFASAMVKRADFVGNIAVNSIQIFAIVLLWVIVYKPSQSIGGFTLTDTVLYYVIILFITYLTTTDTVDYISRNIKYGSFSEWLLKPRSILISEMARSIGEQFYRLIILIPFYALLVIVLNSINVRTQLTSSGILLGGLFILLGFIINCLFEYALAMIAFWFDEIWSLRHFKEVVTDLLGGKKIPLAFFPLWIKSINKFLPFKFIYFIPAQYLLNKHTASVNLFEDLFFSLSWIVIFILSSEILYRFGIRKYGAFGN